MLGLAVGCSSSGTPAASTQPSTVSSSSPSTGGSAAASASPSTLPAGVLASIHVDKGAAPMAAVGGFGSVWVSVHRGNYLYRIDPATNTVQTRIQIVGGQCLPPLAGVGRMWVGPCGSLATVVVDPASNQVVGTTPGKDGGVFAVVDGIPWAYATNAIESLDPHTYKVTRVIHVDANPRFVSKPDVVAAYGDGAFWVIVAADEDQTFGGSIVKIDAKTGKVDQVFDPPEPGNYPDIEFLDHAVWLKGDDSGALVRLDAVTGKMRDLRPARLRSAHRVLRDGHGRGDGRPVDPALQRMGVAFRPGHRHGHRAVPGRPERTRRLRLRLQRLTVGRELRHGHHLARQDQLTEPAPTAGYWAGGRRAP